LFTGHPEDEEELFGREKNLARGQKLKKGKGGKIVGKPLGEKNGGTRA